MIPVRGAAVLAALQALTTSKTLKSAALGGMVFWARFFVGGGEGRGRNIVTKPLQAEFFIAQYPQ